MSQPPKLLVFTDLDGTLLDHHNYSFAAAKGSLAALEAQGFPVVPTTSKTHSELLELRKELDSQHPFIVENGAAVFIPRQYFPVKPDDCIEHDDFWVKAFGLKRGAWKTLLNQLPTELKSRFQSFSQLGDEGVAASTGLSLESAQRANARDFSEPLLWQGSEQELAALEQRLSNHGVGVVAGGRFLHLHNGYNKGIALKWLAELYQVHETRPIHTVALGDSDNDREMLHAANTAVVILNPTKEPLKLDGHTDKLTSTLYGPEGWAECMDMLLTTR